MNDMLSNFNTGQSDVEYLSRIRVYYDSLSNSEKKIADYIINNKDSILSDSINVLAEKIGTSSATITRFCQTLGFKGYNELKFYVEREFLSPSNENVRISVSDSVKIIKQKVLRFGKEVIDETSLALDDGEVEKAVEAISNARKIDIYGEGGSGSTALTAHNLFLMLGLPCCFLNDSALQVMSASQLKKGDVAIGFTFSGRAKNTIDALEVAKQQGATCICITGYINSAITQFSDIVLNTSSNINHYYSGLPAARISELCVLGVLQAGIIVKNYEKIAGNIKKSDSIYDHYMRVK